MRLKLSRAPPLRQTFKIRCRLYCVLQCLATPQPQRGEETFLIETRVRSKRTMTPSKERFGQPGGGNEGVTPRPNKLTLASVLVSFFWPLGRPGPHPGALETNTFAQPPLSPIFLKNLDRDCFFQCSHNAPPRRSYFPFFQKSVT